MKAPSAAAYLFGNGVSVLALAAAAVYIIYRWWIGEASPYLALGAFFVAGYATSCAEQLEKYRLWKLEWDAMEGRAPRRRLAQPFYRYGLGILGLGVLIYMASFSIDQPETRLGIVLLLTGLGVAVLVGFYRLFQRFASRPKKYRDTPVSVFLPVPRHSPSLANAYAALPSYCAMLRVKNQPLRGVQAG